MCELCKNNITGGAVEDVIRARVAVHGWTIMGLADGGFCYTVGLTERHWPELVIRRMPLATGGEMIARLVNAYFGEDAPRAGQRIMVSPESDPSIGLPVRLTPYPGPMGDLDYAAKLYGGLFSVLEVEPDTSTWPIVK